MGCSSSQPSTRPPRARPVNISAPQGGLEMVPQPRRDASGRPIVHQHYNLDRTHLQRALRYAAQYLHSQGADLEIVAVGGAVNTILLQSRNTTHDVDFFNSARTTRDIQLLRAAAQAAEAQSSLPLGSEWLNNSTSLYVSQQILQELSREAVMQNETVFREPGLKVLAAPWMYAIATKMERLGDPRKSKEYDVDDVTTYLHRYISRHNGQPILYSFLSERAAHYRTRINEGDWRRVGADYHRRFNTAGVVFS